MGEKRKLKKVVDGEKEAVNSEKQDTHQDGGHEEMYQDSDNPDSPKVSEDHNDGKKNTRKRKRSVKYPRHHHTSSSDVKARMTFRDKKQLKLSLIHI